MLYVSLRQRRRIELRHWWLRVFYPCDHTHVSLASALTEKRWADTAPSTSRPVA